MGGKYASDSSSMEFYPSDNYDEVQRKRFRRWPP
jgi:hypothetical protein